ncbi:MAG: hypothetical protein ACLR0I_05770 [Streptococcus salivarius]
MRDTLSTQKVSGRLYLAASIWKAIPIINRKLDSTAWTEVETRRWSDYY